MLAKSKLKYFSYTLVILPIATVVIFTIFKVLVYKIGQNNSYYKWIDNLVTHNSILVVILFFNYFLKNSFLLKEFIRSNLLFYISFLISLIINFLIYNLEFLHHCKANYDISFVINIFIIGTVLSSIAAFLCCYLGFKNKVRFSALDLLILFIFIVFQFFLTQGFRII